MLGKTQLYSLLLHRSPAVSFDIFDTLLERDVDRPIDLFLRVGDVVLGAGEGEQFQSARVAAEQTARKKTPGGEVTLTDIYNCLVETGFCDATLAENLQKEEVRQELKSCFPKDSMKPVYDAALARGQKVFLVSDMYLPVETIGAMAERCGYTGYEKLYVSNEYGVSKRSGKLFHCVLEENDLAPKDLVHVGDSIGADLLGARKAGVRALPVSRKNRWKRLLQR